MKIVHKPKKPVPPLPQVADLIALLLATPDDQISQVLSPIDAWKWPRSDMNAWIKVLNKFDAILEDVIKEYDIDKLQLNPFAPATKRKVCDILRFERMLLENSTNRKTYNSYDRLNSLLYASDIDILVLSLHLLLRPSQQYSTQLQISHALSISTPRLLALSKKWSYVHENGISLVDLACPDKDAKIRALPSDARRVTFTFYRTEPSASSATDKLTNTEGSDAMQGSRKPQQSATGPVTIVIDEQTLLSKPMMQVLADTIETYSVPDSYKFELLYRIRAALVLTEGRTAEREKLMVARLLAIAIFGHTHSEAQASTSLFIYEPDLIVHLAELLQVEHNVSVWVQTGAILALDALARYRGKIQEVLTAVNAGVNHGILMALFRKTVNDIADPENKTPHTFIDALLSFVTFIASHASGGNMVVGAGLIPLLIQVIQNKLPIRLPAVSKTMQLVDNVLYSFSNALQVFCNSHGVEALVERIKYEVDSDIEEYGSESSETRDLPISRSAVLKHILRSMHRMMQSSGTTEWLRGLIDMPLLKSIKLIIEHRNLFGPTVLPIAINIMATFVHNEPTSLAIIQEAGLPEAFYNAIEMGLEPVIEVIQAIPNAIGALCLNEAGQAQLAKRPSIIPAIFSIFTSERHTKVLLDKENAVLIGTAIDELIRHHPSLKVPVFDAIKATLCKIEELGHVYVVPSDQQHWYNLTHISTPSAVSDSDVTMEDVTNTSQSSNAAEGGQESEDDDDVADRSHDNEVVSYIDIIGRFLEGLFQHAPHCRDFVTLTDGFTRLGRLTGLPCLPYDYANRVASDSMVQIMRTTVEVVTSETFLLLANLVAKSLQETKEFWENVTEQSKLLPFIDVAPENHEEANQKFRSLVTLHIRITLLSDVFATAGYAHGRASITLLQILMSNTSPQVVSDLGSLHRASVWENIVLLAGLSGKGISVAHTPSTSSLEVSPDQSTVNLDEIEPTTPNPTGTTNGLPMASSSAATSVSNRDVSKKDSREQNAAALKHLTHGLPSSLAPFFQAMVKMFHARRNPDPAQKKQIEESSTIVADIMLKHLKFEATTNGPEIFMYHSVILSLYTALLIDERTSTKSLHTVQLYALYRVGGLDAIFGGCQLFMSAIDSITKIREENRSDVEKKQLLHAYGALKVALHLLHPIISSKPLFDSAQTLITLTRDKKDTDPGYFEPHNFLVKLRLAALPLLQNFWESPWLISAPLGITRYVVHCVLELTNGENEESRGEYAIEIAQSGAATRPPSTGVDENGVQMLTEMGFPRSAAERALARTHNNVNAATELLLNQPFPLPPDPEPESTAEETAAAVSEEAVNPEGPETEARRVEEPEPSEEVTEPQGKSPDEYLKELNEAREPLRATIARQALLLIDEHVSLLFDLHNAFIKPQNGHQQQAIQDLIDDVKSFSPYAYDVQEQPLANRCRLLALVLSETPSSVDQATRDTLTDSLLALLLSSIDLEHPPRWLAAHLLVMEVLLTLSEEPQAITLPKEGEPVLPQRISTGSTRPETRTIVFDFCMRLTSVRDLPGDELLSLLRLLVFFTRDRAMAVQFIARGGIPLLFNRLKGSPVAGSSSYIALILRHIVEDPSIIQGIMRQMIKRHLSQPRSRLVDVVSFVRTWNALALREPQIFIDVTKSLCQLGQPYSSSPHISLKASVTDKPEKPAPGQTSDPVKTEMDIDQSVGSLPTNGGDSAEPVVHFLVSELVLTMKSVNEISHGPASPSTDPQKTTDVAEDPLSLEGTKDTSTHEADFEDKYQYMCFLMQCLSELLLSYDACKNAFLSFSPKKRMHSLGKDIMPKHKMATLQFLLSELITYGTIHQQPDQKARSRISASHWAMSVIVSLCADTPPSEEASPDLVSVRKVVLEAINRAIKDLPASETLDARYGRLLALAELCYRLLTIQIANSTRKSQEETPTHLAKVMLEKNLVATLTSALSEVDLNYPNVRSLVSTILRPLEHLTKLSIKMSRSLPKNKEASEVVMSDSGESYESEEEDADRESREETPDLYRNSALGMYGGEMDDGHYDEDEMDGNEGDEDEDVEMDFENTDSEDTSDSGDEEGEDELEDQEGHGSEEGWDDGEEDEEDEEALLEHEDDDEDDDDQGGDDIDEDEGDDADMMWQNIRGGEGTPGMRIEGDDDEDNAIPVIHEGERDAASDVDDYILEDGVFTVSNILGVGDTFLNANENRDNIGFVMTRRHRGPADENLQVLGRNRNIPAPPEHTTHPLLLDMSPATGRSSGHPQRGSRQAHRLLTTGADVIQTVEELIAGGGVQLFRHIANRTRAGAVGETFRFDIPAGMVVNLERGLMQHRRAPPGIFTTSVRVEHPPRVSGQKQHRELEPLLTMDRWAEEAKILHNEHVLERASKLANHVILALLPAAVDAARKAKIREEQEKQEKAQLEQVQAEEEAKKAAEAAESSQSEGQASEEQAAAPDLATQDAEVQSVTTNVGATGASAIVTTDVDTVMEDATATVAAEASSSTTPPGDQNASDGGASTSQPTTSERVTVMIHGSAVDITDTGIDPTFLEALPDDMREEVLNQHVRDQRAARIERPPDSQISVEFLDALPPEIRAEILQQEAIERARLRTVDSARTAGVPAEIDAASFIASLEPPLRQAVLLEQDDGFLQTLPSHIIAEAGAYRDNQWYRNQPVVQPPIRTTQHSVPRKTQPQHDTVQLLDRVGIAVLVRLLFLPQISKKTLLFKILVNLCENSKARAELFNLLLIILQDGSGDHGSEKSLLQPTPKPVKTQTPKSAAKQKASSDYTSMLALPPNTEIVPDLIAQRCLEALTYIVTSNEQSSLFFLTEHELPAALRRVLSRKGKGKEKQSPQTYYPIVLLLLLLERQQLLRTPAIMESIVGLLATVTRPLSNLKEEAKETTPVTQPPAGVPSSTQSTSAPESAAQAPPATAAAESSKASGGQEDKALLSSPPQIPHPVLRLIVNILTVGECSGRTFQQSLALIQHLSYIPDARDVIAQELRYKAQEAGQSLLIDLDELASALQKPDNTLVVNSVAAKFSPASSLQAKLLRVLKTIDYMYSPRPSSTSPAPTIPDEDVEKVQAIYESFRFTPLWRKLGDCLSLIEEKPETEHIATVLLPLIEALMVVCKYVGSKSLSTASRVLRASASPRSPTTPRESMEELFIAFTDSHRKILNLMVRSNPSLMSGSFSLLVNNPRVLDFDNKRNYFNQQLHRRPPTREHYGTIQLNVRRARVFEDSFQHLQRKTGDQIKYGKLSVRFYQEEGVDAGGVTREWFQILARQMFDPNNALFQPCAADKLTYQPNKNSWVNPEHLAFFKFVGRVIGKAIYDGRLLDAYFARSLYRQLLGKPVDYKDVEWVDPEYYNSLCWILDNDPTGLDLTFNVEADEFGVNRIVPLKLGGESIPVTQENKREYVQLSAQYRLYSSIKDQIESLLEGFYEIIPRDLITIFNEQELELLISGTPDIDVDEWRAATEYNGYTSSDPNIVWWWRALKSFTRDERAKVLSFATGTSRVPLNGFVDLQGVQGVQRFSIHRAYGQPDRLPQAHTCFNQIDLPPYTSYEMLRQQLLLAINEGGEGFAFS
ncbi:hypothetical protein AMATHDRAFT_58882 [Amanita thiersii Skay4041]|uniref:HECT-type E3 ubiquitin transferase n=1 Tax=Amanita thiersii Skay4041 TaxID=703135 RepID=A0A2A9NV10_9AGAR|nr:hypothetical protein AMATHDRAFT_58882 [Amanita thiersii Skay4041]